MRPTVLRSFLRTAALAGAGLLFTAGASLAADVYLQTQSVTKTLPGLVDPVPMWVFVCDPAVPPAVNPSCIPTASGSARINGAPGGGLTVHLTNTLPTPISIAIPGQTQSDGGDPVMSLDARSRERVRSFTHETGAGTPVTPSSAVVYTWSSLRPGTYLYQSGTHPSIQVPMGLYGALVVGPATGVACPSGQQAAYGGPAGPASCYDADTLLLFSEIDPVQNTKVDAAAGDFASYPRTIDYNPIYSLVNGVTSATLPAGDNSGNSVLLRFLNAGLRSHTPAIVGLEMGLVAEDGNPYPGLTRWQSAALLPAGKTLDVLVVTPADDVTFALFDRMPDFSNDAQPDGGMTARLQVGAGSATPPDPTVYAVNDTFPVTEDTQLAIAAAAGVLANDVGLAAAAATVVSGPANGSLVLNADGSFTYTPNLNFSGSDGFTYSAGLGGNNYPAQVTLEVSFANDAPVATADGPYINANGPTITVAAPGVLGNDADPDGDQLTAVIDTPPAGGSLALDPDGSFTYSGGTPGGAVTFSYHAVDSSGWTSTAVTVTLIVNPVANIALTVQDPLAAPVADYRWLVQEDATYHINPAAPPAPEDTLSTNFHKSYMPVVAQGCVGAGCDALNQTVPVAAFNQVALDPAKHYYVSVLPNDAGTGTGHSIGGAPIPPGTTNTTITVIVSSQPIPTAQISVLVFEDKYPTNGVPDPVEPRLGGFQINLEDAGGRYGISGGMMSQDAFGMPLKNSIDCFGSAPPPMGVILTCPDTPANQTAKVAGQALIKDLPPGKYGIIAVPPAGEAGNWTQTTTIEGTKVIDAWVKAGEPPVFAEFGVASFHAFMGFVNPAHLVNPGGSNTITGRVTMMHPGRPPNSEAFDSDSYDALAHTRAWVGLNSDSGIGPNIQTIQAAPDGSFTLTGIPDGSHQLVVWDAYLDQIIFFQTVTLNNSAGAAVGNIPVPTWFGRHEHNVFLDENGDGVRQTAEQTPLTEQVVNLRFRDGTVFQSFPTDTEGFVPFDQIFPFGSWQVAEVDYTRFKATGVTVTVDGGGDVSGGPYPGLLNPQVGTPRTETGPVLTEGFQSMAGMTSIFEWGKKPYEPGENGGISGIVFYGSTRGENDPRYTVGDPWEPGIPGVKVRLYREVATGAGGTALALVQEVETDSWDAATPSGCAGESPTDPFVTQTLAGDATRCFDGVRNFEQVRPAVFDGGYAFNDIAPGTYVVEVVPPPGYELIKEEDKNVDFGDAFATAPVAMLLPGGAMLTGLPDQAMVQAAMTPEPGLAQPPCVGQDHLVPDQLSLFPGVDTYAPFAGTMRPLCDRKRVILSDQGQAAADFHLFTSTPVAGQFQGLVTDDIAIETNPASASFGDKWGPAYMPISMRDFQGREIYRGYSDAFGRYNGVLPSTFTANIPIPSGYSPAMHLVCLNDPGPIPGPGGALILDPLRNQNYGTFCYTLQYMPGTTTYLDTPLIPQAAFAAGFNSVDCAFPDGTPVISSVERYAYPGSGPFVQIPEVPILDIVSRGDMQVPNPAYEGPSAPAPYNQLTIARDFGFGETPGTVSVGGTSAMILAWSNDRITAWLNPLVPTTEELVVTRGDNGKATVAGVTVTLGNETPISVSAGGSIQAAIDAAAPGSLILVGPGTYDELVVMWKPVRLQGSGTATIINALRLPSEKLETWRQKVKGLVDNGDVDLLPGQPGGEFDLVGGGLFGTEQGAGITVLAKNDPGNVTGRSFSSSLSRIDGFTITGADGGGGIFVNGYAHNLEISNNHVTSNMGNLSGGVRVGHPYLPPAGTGPFAYNTGVNIHHNAVTLNGARSSTAVGGGLALSTGTDTYTVSRNYVCGNFSLGDGGGIGHLGLSSNAQIQSNQILFNQSFNTGGTRSGGGIMIAGEPSAAGLTLGAGNVTVDGNLIQGNQAGSGHGGGIRTQSVNGTDATGSPWSVTLSNNMIVNNVAGWSGAGISLQDTTTASIINNTIANNDSTATVGALVAANASTPQPAGISAERHSLALATALGNPAGFSNPSLVNNIVWHNRTFTYDATAGAARLLPVLTPSAVGGCPAGASYWDLGVIGEPLASPALRLSPSYSILSDATGYPGANNNSGNPDFLSAYCNGARTLSTLGPMQVAAEVIEGGNFIDVRYGPLAQSWPAGSAPWNYHIGAVSAGMSNGTSAGAPNHDFDGEIRPQGWGVDRGADEVDGGPPIGSTDALLFFSTAGNFRPPGVDGPVDDADIYSWNGTTFARVFDAAGTGGAGLPGGADIDGLLVVDADTFYMSFKDPVDPPGPLGTVQDEDIVLYDAGVWSLYFDGSVVGLGNGNSEDVDAFDILTDGSLVISTSGNGNVPGVGGFNDEDLLRCVGTFGQATTCTWSVYFDGSDVALTADSEDVDGVSVSAGNIYLSTTGNFNVAGLTGQGVDVFVCNAPTTGTASSCASFGLFFDGSLKGITNNLDAIDLP